MSRKHTPTIISKLFFALLFFSLTATALAESTTIGKFHPGTDLYLPQFDSKTDVDDLHSVAAVATLLRHPELDGVRYRAVAGAYGIQGGLYVPSPELFTLAFGDNWSDAHNHREKALGTVTALVLDTLRAGGSVWVAEAGQSDFTADWLKVVLESHPAEAVKEKVNVVQHSDWNEEVTDAKKLSFVKKHATYHKIPDGNGPGNGTPGFKTDSGEHWERVLADEINGATWREARDKGSHYNGLEERYYNTAIGAGGMDFSDVAESCFIFGCVNLYDSGEFFDQFLQ